MFKIQICIACTIRSDPRNNLQTISVFYISSHILKSEICSVTEYDTFCVPLYYLLYLRLLNLPFFYPHDMLRVKLVWTHQWLFLYCVS